MSPTIRHKYKYFHSTVQRAKDRRQKFHLCRLPFDVRPRKCFVWYKDHTHQAILTIEAIDHKQYTTGFYGLQADKPRGMLIEHKENL